MCEHATENHFTETASVSGRCTRELSQVTVRSHSGHLRPCAPGRRSPRPALGIPAGANAAVGAKIGRRRCNFSAPADTKSWAQEYTGHRERY